MSNKFNALATGTTGIAKNTCSGGGAAHSLNFSRNKFLSIFISIILCFSLLVAYTPEQAHAAGSLGTWTDAAGVNYDIFGTSIDDPARYAVITGPDTYAGALTVLDSVNVDGGNGSGSVASENYGTYPITEIGANAFQYNNWGGTLTEINLSGASNLKTIGSNAFYYCNGVRGALIIPGNVDTIGYYAFASCNNIDSLTISEGVEEIIERAFYECSALDGELIIPSTVNTIGANAFYACRNLDSLKISEGVDTISTYAFAECTGLTGELVIPSTVKLIGDSAFYYCNNLESLIISEGIEELEIQRYAFNQCGALDGELIIPSRVSTIGEYAISQCPNLDSLIFSGSSVEIGYQAFFWNPQLNTIKFEGSVPTSIGTDAFRGCPADGVLFYPRDAETPPYTNFINTYLTGQDWSLCPTLSATPASIPASSVNMAITPINVAAEIGGGTIDYKYDLKAIQGNNLPNGLSLASSSGEVSGIPTERTPSGSVIVEISDSGTDLFFQSTEIIVPYGAVLNADATLVSYELGGVTGGVGTLGTPNKLYDKALAGAVTLTETQAEKASFVGIAADANAKVEYAYTAADTDPTLLFNETWTSKTIANNSYVWAKVTAEDGTTTLIYKIKVTVTGSGQIENPDHHILFHSHDKSLGGKDGLTAFGEDVVVQFEGDLNGSNGVTKFVFNDIEYTLSVADDEKSIAIADLEGDNVSTITSVGVEAESLSVLATADGVEVTLPAAFADRLENGTHELQVWFSDSTVKAEAGVADIVVNREGKPIVPQTGDEAHLNWLLTLGGISLVTLLALIAYRRKTKTA
ncbi:MAG: leucine-rich repeat protein [Clostridiales Family XIII bacterium]|jgi:LPXTG-motif cell wall-anchored protein|nr:leucine-rich repeat protein [Clostridiales Family XIII bacterium]